MVHKILIKNMVSPSCIKVVTDELTNLGLKVSNVKLGQVTVASGKTIDMKRITETLNKNGFDILISKEDKLVEEIKHLIIKAIQNEGEKLIGLNFVNYLSQKTKKPYRLISKVFSANMKITIEHYIILEKIEKTKELLEYGEMNVSEISYYLGYRTVQHLSFQFKRITGISPSQYKLTKKARRKGINNV